MQSVVQPSQVQQFTEPKSQQTETIEALSKVVTPVTDFDVSGYYAFDAKTLALYSEYLNDMPIVVTLQISNLSSTNDISANIDTDTKDLDVTCKLASGVAEAVNAEAMQEGYWVTVAGKATESSSFLSLDFITLENCVVIGYGESLANLPSGASNQYEIAEQLKADAEAKKAAQEASEIAQLQDECVSVTATEVMRNPTQYDGTKVYVTGYVMQVVDSIIGKTTYMVMTDDGLWQVKFELSDDSPRILEGDVVWCYGTCTGTSTYTTALGVKNTVPSMQMEYVEYTVD